MCPQTELGICTACLSNDAINTSLVLPSPVTIIVPPDANTVFYRDYAHPYCVLHSSYRWDGLNFKNGNFVSKLRPLTKKRNSFLSEACQRLKYNEYTNYNYSMVK